MKIEHIRKISESSSFNITGLSLIELTKIQILIMDAVENKIEILAYFKACIESNNGDISPDEIYDLKEIISYIEQDIEMMSHILNTIMIKNSDESEKFHETK